MYPLIIASIVAGAIIQPIGSDQFMTYTENAPTSITVLAPDDAPAREGIHQPYLPNGTPYRIVWTP